MAGWTFSDNIIGTVQTRASGSERFVDPAPRDSTGFRLILRPDPVEAARAVAELGNRPILQIPATLERAHDGAVVRMLPLTRVLGHLDKPHPVQLSPQASIIQPAESLEITETVKGPKKRVRVKTERRKEQCRTNQARYRNKQRLHRVELEDTVLKLREEVEGLEQHYRSLSYRIYSSHSIWNVVVEYFRLFRHGISIFAGVENQRLHKKNCQLAVDSALPAPSWTSLMRSSPTGQTQVEFLKAVMAPDIELVGSGDYGVDALVDHWLRWVRCFQDVELHLDRVEQAPGVADAVIATARVSATITSDTVRKVFGHLLDDNSANRSQNSELAWRLCGQRIEFKCCVWFECDSQSNQVQRFRSEASLVPAFQRLVASLSNTAQVLNGALLTSGGYLVTEDA